MNTKQSRQDMIPALEAFKSLENDLAEVKYAAGLAAGLINRFPSYEKQPDGMVSVTMRLDELEQLDFAVYEVHRRAKALNDTYHGIDVAEEGKPAGRKVAAPVPRAASCPVDALDRLNEGVMLLHTCWLAMAGSTFDHADPPDFEALTDTVWQALAKFQDAKKGLGA